MVLVDVPFIENHNRKGDLSIDLIWLRCEAAEPPGFKRLPWLNPLSQQTKCSKDC